MTKLENIKIPKYTLGEELWNSITHGIGALLAIAGLVLMLLKANTKMEIVTASVYGVSMIILYLISCIYHALSPRLNGKKVLRVLDHCNVLLLVAGTYTPMALVGVKGTMGWVLFGITWAVTILSIVLTAIDVDKYQYPEVVCNLLVGWSICLGVPQLISNCTIYSVIFLVAGGLAYSVGAILYKIGAKKKGIHSVFHVFVLLGSILHFLMIYWYVL